jgi:hypothetical protein|tara:strand:- start:257 stop:460 length:204 start_codon:yes stop_codon:yes gene_type:complete
LEIVSSDEVKSIVRCTKCKEIVCEWSHEHLQDRMTETFGLDNINFESSFPNNDFLRELTDLEREELK